MPGPKAPPSRVKLGVSGRPDQASLELALRRGYFEKQGLAIETIQASSGTEFVSSLAADQIQVASGSPNAGLFKRAESAASTSASSPTSPISAAPATRTGRGHGALRSPRFGRGEDARRSQGPFARRRAGHGADHPM